MQIDRDIEFFRVPSLNQNHDFNEALAQELKAIYDETGLYPSEIWPEPALSRLKPIYIKHGEAWLERPEPIFIKLTQ